MLGADMSEAYREHQRKAFAAFMEVLSQLDDAAMEPTETWCFGPVFCRRCNTVHPEVYPASTPESALFCIHCDGHVIPITEDFIDRNKKRKDDS